jgi:ABC-type nitrate/sulfonate/bicarbonate transport system ATPase subunit
VPVPADGLHRQLLQEDLLNLCQEHPKTVVFLTHSMEEAVCTSRTVSSS